MNAKSEEFVLFIRKYLHENYDAISWCLLFVAYLHDIDDIIDKEIGKIPKARTDNEAIIRTFALSETVYTHPFYILNINALRPLVKMAFNGYADSVVFEQTDVEWKKKAADVLRQNANEVLLAVVEIVNGYETKRAASLELRGLAYETHHLTNGEPV
jgi:hypothetical protein